MLDELDIEILKILQTEGRISNRDLAEKVNLSPSATHARLQKLEDQGYIDYYTAILNHKKLGLNLLCLVNISISLQSPEDLKKIRHKLTRLPEVLECYHITGGADILLKVIMSTPEDLEIFITQKILPIRGIISTATNIVLSEFKAATALPLENLSRAKK